MEFDIFNQDVDTVTECQVCESIDFNKVSSVNVKGINFFETSICRQCGLVVRTRRPSLDWLINCWNQRDKNQKEQHVLPIDPKVESDRYQRYLGLEELLNNYTNEKRVLDVGSGTGGGLKSFKDKGWNVLGIEPDDSRARYGIETYGVDTIVDTFENVLIESKFPLVTMIHSLEHFRDPLEKLKLAKEFVEDGGVLYIAVPDALTRIQDWSDSIYLGHLVNFMEYNLCLLGARIGLTPILRTYPRTTEFGVDNLGILFRNDNKITSDTTPKTRYTTGGLQKDILRIIDRYHSNRKTHNGILYLNLEQINDLSLGFKGPSYSNHFNNINSNYLTLNSNGTYNVKPCENDLVLLTEKLKSFSIQGFSSMLGLQLARSLKGYDANFKKVRFSLY